MNRAFVRLGIVIVGAFLLLLAVRASQARDLGQWENSDASISAWFSSLKQPDNPKTSCCGEADAYYADSYHVEGDKYVAIITDERPDEPLKRRNIPVGTKIVVPNYKIKFDQGNPTGHGIIFVQNWGGGYEFAETVPPPEAMKPNYFVLCYLPPGGV